MTPKRLTYLFTLLLLIVGTLAQGQSPVFSSYSLLPRYQETKVNTIFQGEDHVMWFATSAGIIRFDGLEKQLYEVSDSIASKDVTALGMDSVNRLWVGHKSGHLHYLENDQLQLFDPDEGHSSSPISDIIFDQAGNLWFSTLGEGVYYYVRERLYNLDMQDGLPDNYVYDLHLDQEGTVWIGTDGGAAAISGIDAELEVKIVDYNTGLPDNIIRCIASDDEGKLFFGTEEFGVVSYDPSTNEVLHPFLPVNWSYWDVTDLSFSDQQMWIATSKHGLFAYDLERKLLKHYAKVTDQQLSRINALWNDREGNLWIGTNAGVFRSLGDRLLTFEEAGKETVLDLAVDAEGKFWSLTPSGITLAYHDSEERLIAEQPFANSPYQQWPFVSVYADEQGDVWFGSYGMGVLRRRADGTIESLDASQLFDGNVLDICRTGNAVWLATFGGASQLLLDEQGNIQEIKNYNTAESLGNYYIYRVFVDRAGNSWFGTDGYGVISITENGSLTRYGQEQGLFGKVIYGIAEDAKGNIWVNTQDAGLFRLHAGTFEAMGIDQGFRDEPIDVLTTDRKGNMVAVHRIGADIYDVAQDAVILLNHPEELQEYLPSLNAFDHDVQGQLWIGTERGLMAYGDITTQSGMKPALNIRSINLFGQPVDRSNDLEFSHNQNGISISYHAYWYQAPELVNYRYQMAPYDPDWIYSSNHEANYSSLPPGQYTFKVQASVSSDFSQAEEVELSFVIHAPLWQQPWFIITTALLMLLGIYLIIRMRERRLMRDKQVLELRVEERTEEIRQQKDQIQQASEEIMAKNESLNAAYCEIEEQNESIKQSISYAMRIQTAILPLDRQFQENFEDHFILFKPRDIVSGDFYWLKQQGERIYFAAVDCTGHGVPGALMSMMGYSMLNEIIVRHEGIAPADVMLKLHEGISIALKQDYENAEDHQRQNDGMDVAICCFDRSVNKLYFTGANRPLYKVLNGELEVIKGNRASIGGRVLKKKNATSDEKRFETIEIPVEAGSWIYIFSDGYPDQFGGPDGRKFMIKRLRDLITEAAAKPSKEQHQLLDQEIENWKANEEQTDDILLMGIKF